jgi:DNA-binding CsgD family transcriptional regulator/catechol 2,3-dioxygenase-like lactoylglutathione lyase family enzyme
MKAHSLRGRPKHPDILTPGEWRVAELIRHGLTNRSIAELLGVSADGVKFHVASILSKLGFTRRAEIRKWTGVRADSALIQLKVDEEPIPAFGHLGQIARSVKDIVDAERWYRDVLGLAHLYTFGKFAFFDCEGTRLFLSEGQGDASILYFDVRDIRTSYAQFESRGVKFITAPHLVHRHSNGTEEWMAFFEDHEGRPLALMAQVPLSAVSKSTKEEQA